MVIQKTISAPAADREDAYRLRYEVYVAEQGRSYLEANHKDRLLSDALDADGGPGMRLISWTDLRH